MLQGLQKFLRRFDGRGLNNVPLAKPSNAGAHVCTAATTRTPPPLAGASRLSKQYLKSL